MCVKVVSPTFVGLSKAGEAAISSLVAAVSLQFLNWTATPTHGAWQNVSRPQGAAEAERAVLIANERIFFAERSGQALNLRPSELRGVIPTEGTHAPDPPVAVLGRYTEALAL